MLFLTATGGQTKELGGQLPSDLYVKRGPGSISEKAKKIEAQSK